jgi:trehalose-phosphatase
MKKLSQTLERILVMDYDGTIAPFCADRRRAFPYPGVADLLQHISAKCDTRLIVITSRAGRELVRFLGFSTVSEIWGTYGLERLYMKGSQWRHRYVETALSEEAARDLALVELHLDLEGLREHIEVKLAGVAVHWRGLHPEAVSSVRKKALAILEPLARHPSLVLAEFDQGLEIRLRLASKDSALKTLLREIGVNTAIAYLGDDATDEDAFPVINGTGLTILVRFAHGSMERSASLFLLTTARTSISAARRRIEHHPCMFEFYARVVKRSC